jgi:hypothetical protein
MSEGGARVQFDRKRLPDGREIEAVYADAVECFISGSMDDRDGMAAGATRFERSLSTTRDSVYEWRYLAALVGGESGDGKDFFGYVEDIEPNHRGGINGLFDDLIVFLDRDFSSKYEAAIEIYDEKLAELANRREELHLEPTRFVDIIRKIAASYYKAGGNFCDLISAGYVIAEGLYGPEAGETKVNQILAAISDSWGDYSDEDRIAARGIRDALRENSQEDLKERTLHIEGVINRGESLDWEDIEPLLEAFNSEIEDGWEPEEEVCKFMDLLADKYKPEDENKGVFEKLKDLFGSLGKEEDEGEGETLDENELDFFESLVRLSVKGAIARKVIVLTLASAGGVGLAAGGVVGAAVKGTLESGTVIASEAAKGLWNGGLTAWEKLRTRQQDLSLNKDFENIWKSQLDTANLLREVIVEMVLESRESDAATSRDVSYGVNRQEQTVQITVDPTSASDELNREEFEVTLQKDDGRQHTYQLSVPVGENDILLGKIGEYWIRNKSIFERGVAVAWDEINYRDIQLSPALKIRRDRVINRPDDESEVLRNQMIASLGVFAAMPSVRLFVDGLGHLLPSPKSINKLNEANLRRLEMRIDNIEDIMRGWSFLCQAYLTIDVGALQSILDDSSEIEVFEDSVQGERTLVVTRHLSRVNEILGSRRLTFSQRLELLAKLGLIGKFVSQNTQFNLKLLKDDMDLSRLFETGNCLYDCPLYRMPHVLRREMNHRRKQSFSRYESVQDILKTLSRGR